MEQPKKTLPDWLSQGLLMLVITLSAVFAYHFLIVKKDKDLLATTHFALAHEKALGGFVDAMSMISLMYNDIKLKEQELKMRIEKLELSLESDRGQASHE